MQSSYVTPVKSGLVQIKINNVTYPLPDMKHSTEAKSRIIAKWLMNWIDEDLRCGKISVNNLLPAKSDLAYFFGVSVGTVQNALRTIEDMGYVESKQRIGTLIKDRTSSGVNMRKLTSKREIAIAEIKKFIVGSKLKKNSFLPSSRTLATLIGCSFNTTRSALEYLCSVGILSHNTGSSNESGWQIISLNFDKKKLGVGISQKTLVSKVEQDLKVFIDTNLKVGDKLPPHAKLSLHLKVSIKTIHDALKSLVNKGILLPRRGRYGTTVIKLPSEAAKGVDSFATSIFAPAKDTAFYYYEKTQNSIKKMIAENYEVGSKLPSILELSKEMDLSPNTIRKAFHNLAREGYIVFSRGRYGGTFVIDIPETGEETFKWLAVNPQYAKMYSGNN